MVCTLDYSHLYFLVKIHKTSFPISENMLSLALRLLAISSALSGIVFCAQISSAVLRKSAKQIIMDQERLIQSTGKALRPQLTLDTSFTSERSQVIVEVTPRADYTLSEFLTAALQLSIKIMNAFDLRSERAYRLHKKLGRSKYQWAASTVQFSPAIV